LSLGESESVRCVGSLARLAPRTGSAVCADRASGPAVATHGADVVGLCRVAVDCARWADAIDTPV
jgi:hypothetical protein